MDFSGLTKLDTHARASAMGDAGRLDFRAAMPLEALSVGEAMQYLGTYLGKSDREIRAKMEELQQSKQNGEKLGDKITTLQTIMRNADGDGWVRDPALVQKAHDLFKDDPQLLSILSPAARDALARLDSHYGDTKIDFTAGFTKLVGGSSGAETGKTGILGLPEVSDARVHKDDLDSTIKALTEQASQLSSSNELKMIQLQSAISARGNLLSMVSNMVKSFDDNAKSIVGNMR